MSGQRTLKNPTDMRRSAYCGRSTEVMSELTRACTAAYPSKYFSITSTTNGATTTATSTSYIYAGDTLVSYIEQALINGTATGTPSTYYVHPDHLGSTNVITSASGTVLMSKDYMPFGSTRIESGNTAMARGYIGQFEDENLLYLQARYMDPMRGQFLSQDPIFLGDPKGQLLTDPQALNSYSYASNNPITRSDPTGKFWWKEFYTNWNGYCVSCFSRDNGLILKAGEVLGGRFAAQDAIAANSGNIAASAAQTGVSPSVYQSIMYEENSHQFPPFGGERAMENAFPGSFTGGVGVMQVTSRTSGLPNSELLGDAANVNAAGMILQKTQSKYGSNPVAIGSIYNSGSLTNTHGQNYGQRVNSYTNMSMSPTLGDRAVRGAAGGVGGILSAMAATLSAISSILSSMSK